MSRLLMASDELFKILVIDQLLNEGLQDLALICAVAGVLMELIMLILVMLIRQ